MKHSKVYSAPKPLHERNALIEAHAGMVPRIVGRLLAAGGEPPWRDRDDMIGEGNLALVVAARDWDGSVPFPVFAYGRVRRAVVDADRSESRHYVYGDDCPLCDDPRNPEPLCHLCLGSGRVTVNRRGEAGIE